jgi:hypothetical protein
LLRTLGWSFGVALALLLLMAPSTAKAADPEDGTSLLGGLGGGLSKIVDPIIDTAEPVTDVLDPVITQVVEPVIEPVVGPIVEPVVAPATRLLEPVTAIAVPVVEPVAGLVKPLVEPIVEPLVEPVLDPLLPVVEPVVGLVDPVLDPVVGVVEPILEPVHVITDPVLEPILEPVERIEAVPSGGSEAAPEGAVPESPPRMPIAYPPAVDPGPGFTPPMAAIQPDEPSPSTSTPGSATGRVNPAADVASVFEANDLLSWTPPAVDPRAAAGLLEDSVPLAPWWTRLGPIGALSGLGSGQVLSGVSFGIAAALGLLMLFLLPPPFRVSRLHLAAVFWQPQRFVGPLVPPG